MLPHGTVRYGSTVRRTKTGREEKEKGRTVRTYLLYLFVLEDTPTYISSERGNYDDVTVPKLPIDGIFRTLKYPFFDSEGLKNI